MNTRIMITRREILIFTEFVYRWIRISEYGFYMYTFVFLKCNIICKVLILQLYLISTLYIM